MTPLPSIRRERLTCHVPLRVSPEQRKRLAAAAAMYGVTISELIRNAMELYLTAWGLPAPSPPPPDAPA